MQLQQEIRHYAPSLAKAAEWIRELSRRLHTDDPEVSARAFRVVLQALRDRLIPDEAADLAAQLPLLIRGVYYEGWRPSTTPLKQRDVDGFLQSIDAKLQTPNDPDARTATEAVFGLLEQKISEGEIDDVRRMMPETLQSLWGIGASA